MAELIFSMRAEVDCIVLAGGDGTLSAGAIALRDTGLPLGVLPLGTANDLARSLGIPLDPASAAAVVLAGHTRPITLGSVNGQPFFTAASVGLRVEQTRALRRAARRRLGGMRYTVAALRALAQVRRFSAIIRCGPAVHRVRTVQVTVGNGRFFAGGLVTDPGPVDETMLGVFSLEPPTRWGLMSMAQVFAAGEGQAGPAARMVRSATVEVVTRVPQTIYADGEKVSLTPARFGLLPQAVSVYVPAPDGSEAGPNPSPGQATGHEAAGAREPDRGESG